jgi:hypothetical protein
MLVRAHSDAAEFWLVALAAGAMTFAFALTVIVNFRINDQLMTWNPVAPPDTFREIWSPREKAHGCFRITESANERLEAFGGAVLKARKHSKVNP